MTGPAPAAEPERWRAWIGREERAADTIDAGRAQAMQAALDDRGAPLGPGDPLPPLWHWLYFWSVAPASALGPDGHPARGAFLPPIELPRRMWAGSRVTFHRPLPIGAEATRRSTIAEVKLKEGRNGRLAFVTVRHEIALPDGPCLVDEHDIVYREAPRPDEAPRPGEPAPAQAPWRRELRADPVLLFRYSALTFNGHRIHYDRAYATETEGYPGLVVHGPLLATLMAEQVRTERPSAAVTYFEFRALRPIFDTAPFTVAGRPAADGRRAELWVADPQGLLAMTGRAELASPHDH
ncbi:MAG: MaoC family dehydratase N-terminal domain-containing protein [Kiloniellaceae bacterium]